MAKKIDLFRGPRLKIERAKKHISELEFLLATYGIAEHQSLLGKKDIGGIIKFGSKLPDEIPTVIGDALHNIRSALDHAYCIMTERNGGTIDRNTKFPFGQDRTSVAASINGHEKLGITPSRAVLDFILDEVQPYIGGNGGLYFLSALNNADKHIILTPSGIVSAIHGMNVVHKGGTTLKIRNFPRFKTNEDSYAGLVIPDAERIEFEKDFQLTFNIVFGEGQPLEGEGIIDTLSKYLILAEGVIRSFEKRFL